MSNDPDGVESAQREKDKRNRQDTDKGPAGGKPESSNKHSVNQPPSKQQPQPAKPQDGRQPERKPQPLPLQPRTAQQPNPASKPGNGTADRDAPASGGHDDQNGGANPQTRRPGHPDGAAKPDKEGKRNEGKKGDERIDEDGEDEPN